MIQSLTRLTGRDVKKLLPEMYPAVVALGKSADAAGLEPALIGLVNLRASQINGCAYCVQMHIVELQELGFPQEKINLVVAWQEAGIFSEREEAALAFTEALTLIAETHVPDETYEAASSVFSGTELVGLTAAISTINVWNRISVTFRFPPEV
jgi:AhpD family alkylhydroperoxidase